MGLDWFVWSWALVWFLLDSHSSTSVEPGLQTHLQKQALSKVPLSTYIYLFMLTKFLFTNIYQAKFQKFCLALENGLIYFVDLMPFTALYSSNVRHKYISISQVLYNLFGFLQKELQILLSLTALNIRYDVKNKSTSTSLIEYVRWLRKWLQHYTKLITFSTFYSRYDENNKYISRSSIIFVWLLRKWAPIFCWVFNF